MDLVHTIGSIVQLRLELLVLAVLCLALLFYVMLVRSRDEARMVREELNNTRVLIENLSEGIYRSSLSGRLISGNAALARLNGCASIDELFSIVTDIGTEWYVEPERRQQFRQCLLRDGVVKEFVSEVYRYKSRERIWVSEGARLVRDEKTGIPLYYEGSVREITNTMKRLQQEERFSKLMSQAPGALFQFTTNRPGDIHIGFISSGFGRVTGFSQDAIKHDAFLLSRQVHEDDAALFRDGIVTSAAALAPLELEFRFFRADGEMRWMRMLATPERIKGGVTFHGYLFDVSERKAQELEIEQLAFYDPLTDLPNRRLFKQRISEVIENRRLDGGHSTLLFIDLDNFKHLNDTHGHDAGDQVLVEIAGRLRDCVGEAGTVARIGGDEFIVILEAAAPSNAAAMEAGMLMANRVLSAMRCARTADLEAGAATASVGVVVFDCNAANPDEILKKADQAMYRAKANGRDGVALHGRHAAPATKPDPPRLLA